MSVAHEAPKLKLDMIMMTACSLMLKCVSGFRVKFQRPKILKVFTGSKWARRHPSGKLSNCATSEVIVTLGYRIEKNWLIPDPS